MTKLFVAIDEKYLSLKQPLAVQGFKKTYLPESVRCTARNVMDTSTACFTSTKRINFLGQILKGLVLRVRNTSIRCK